MLHASRASSGTYYLGFVLLANDSGNFDDFRSNLGPRRIYVSPPPPPEVNELACTY